MLRALGCVGIIKVLYYVAVTQLTKGLWVSQIHPALGPLHVQVEGLVVEI